MHSPLIISTIVSHCNGGMPFYDLIETDHSFHTKTQDVLTSNILYVYTELPLHICSQCGVPAPQPKAR